MSLSFPASFCFCFCDNNEQTNKQTNKQSLLLVSALFMYTCINHSTLTTVATSESPSPTSSSYDISLNRQINKLVKQEKRGGQSITMVIKLRVLLLDFTYWSFSFVVFFVAAAHGWKYRDEKKNAVRTRNQIC